MVARGEWRTSRLRNHLRDNFHEIIVFVLIANFTKRTYDCCHSTRETDTHQSPVIVLVGPNCTNVLHTFYTLRCIFFFFMLTFHLICVEAAVIFFFFNSKSSCSVSSVAKSCWRIVETGPLSPSTPGEIMPRLSLHLGPAGWPALKYLHIMQTSGFSNCIWIWDVGHVLVTDFPCR